MTENNPFDLWKKYEYNSTEVELKNSMEEECTCLCLDPESILFEWSESEPCLTKPCSECKACECKCTRELKYKTDLLERMKQIKEEREYSCPRLFESDSIAIYPLKQGNLTMMVEHPIGTPITLFSYFCRMCGVKLPHPREDTETSRTYKTIRSERKTPLDD